MTPNRTAITISLALHGSAICLVFALSISFAHPSKPIEIDFSVIEPSGPPAPPAQAPRKKAETPVMEKTQPVVHQPAQKPIPLEPATQPQGTVPVLANPRQTPPAPAEQASSQAVKGAPGGGSSVSSQGSGGGSGNSAEKLRSKYLAEHFAYIQRIINDNIVYPDRAKRMRWTGRCVVEFIIMENGRTKNIRILKSTGYELLDDNVEETIKKVEPFPKPPVSAILKIPITYGLE